MEAEAKDYRGRKTGGSKYGVREMEKKKAARQSKRTGGKCVEKGTKRDFHPHRVSRQTAIPRTETASNAYHAKHKARWRQGGAKPE